MNDPIFKHALQVFDSIFGVEIDGRQTPQYKALQHFDRPCLDCGHTDCECCPQCIALGEQCEQCAEDSPAEGESSSSFDARCAGVSRYGEL